MPPDSQTLLQNFLSLDSLEELLPFINEHAQILFAEETLAFLAHLAQTAEDPQIQQHIQERAVLLMSVQAFAAMSPLDRLFMAFLQVSHVAEMVALITDEPTELLDELETLAQNRLDERQGEEREALQRRLDSLRQIRTHHPKQVDEDLADLLIAWIQTHDWRDSETYLRQHETELLTDEAEAVLAQLAAINPDNKTIPQHQTLLQQCRQAGIETAYALFHMSPAQRAFMAYLSIEDEQAAQQLLKTQAALLLTVEVLHLWQAISPGQIASADRLVRRQQQWQAAYQAKTGQPLRPQTDETFSPQPETWAEQTRQQPAPDEYHSKYTVLNAQNCAIGDNALTINHIGRLPLVWKHPTEGRPELAKIGIGRQQELTDLHKRLSTEHSAALVSQGTAAAVRGQPGIGKTVLAAMYVAHYQAHYPGGTLWLNIGPTIRTAESVTPLLQHICSYAYQGDSPQAQTMLENCVFSPQVVQALLSGHGRLLVVADDVWESAALAEIQAALPADSCLLLTTRDYEVAFAVEQNEAAIQPLDVLNPQDARLLLQTRVPDLSSELADQLAKGVGYHALALDLAAGALNSRRKFEAYSQTIAEILQRVAEGRGFGDLPRLDKQERLSQVEIILKYSYDYLGEGNNGRQQQTWFRLLGVFAQETTFATAAAAALWQVAETTATEFLIALDGLGLIQGGQQQGENRWQQHAILRAYALSLQPTSERIDGSERHADYYLALTRTCYQQKPRAYDRVEQEFTQIEHAFAWCQQHSPPRALQFTQWLDSFMIIRGRATQAGEWLRLSLQTAKLYGDRAGTANTLKSLGDLESRLGNIAQARQHYNEALPLYEVEQDPTGKMNTWVSMARLEAASGNWSAVDQLFQETFALAAQINFSDHPVVQEWREEYQKLRATNQDLPESPTDPLALPLLAFLDIDSADSFEKTLQGHPILLELPALSRLVEMGEALIAANQPAAVLLHLFVRVMPLFELYQQQHVENVKLEDQQSFVALCERWVRFIQPLQQPELETAMRRMTAWAFNTLGNQFVAQKQLETGIAAYTQAIAYDEQNAMLYRNRAGELIELGLLEQARADLQRAAELEPEAARLPSLWQQLQSKEKPLQEEAHE